METKNHYEPPTVEVFSVVVEKGFSATGTPDDFGWGGDLSGNQQSYNMKKLMKRYILSLLSLVVLAACSSYDESFEKPIDEPTDNNIAEKYFVYANIDNTSNTRVAMTPGTNADGNPIIKVNWEESGEQFLVYRDFELTQEYLNDNPYLFTQVPSSNKFEGDIPVSGKGYSAFYNCSLSLGQSGPHTHKMNYDMSEQNGTGDKVLMMGESQNETGVIDFDHLGFILKPTFKYKNVGMDDWEVLNSSITKIEMGGNLQYVDDENSKKQITVTPTSALDDIYIFLPKLSLYPYATTTNAGVKVQYNAGDTFTFRVTTEDGEYTGSLTLPAEPTLEAGKFYTATIKLANTRSKLPEGTKFKDQLVGYINSYKETHPDTQVHKIKFVPNSSNTEGKELTEITEGSPVYFVINEGTAEIRSAAKTFVFNSDCSNMFSKSSPTYELLNDIISIDFAGCCDTSKVTNMQDMFSYCLNLYGISNAKFDTSNVTNMCRMFYACGENVSPFSELINMSTFTTSKVTNMEEMFGRYSGRKLDISKFDMSSVKTVKDMFANAIYLNELYLGDLKNFKIDDCNLENMFLNVGISNNNDDGKAKIYVGNDDILNKLQNATNTGIDSNYAKLVKQ